MGFIGPARTPTHTAVVPRGCQVEQGPLLPGSVDQSRAHSLEPSCRDDAWHWQVSVLVVGSVALALDFVSGSHR